MAVKDSFLSYSQLFFLILTLAGFVTATNLQAHPEDELCPPGELPSGFCLAVAQQAQSNKSIDKQQLLENQQSPMSFGSITWEYIKLGYRHIVPKGLDHLLFVLALFLSARQLKPLVLQITVFTLAHSVSLALAALGWVSVSSSFVEPLIAASIAYVAIENIVSDKLHLGRPFIVFLFGLLHGLGFAGVLLDLGLPDSQFLLGLISFNVGVELGQLSVIMVALLLCFWAQNKDWYRSRIVVPASILIAAVGVYWTVARLLPENVVFGTISAATANDLPATLAKAMLFG